LMPAPWPEPHAAAASHRPQPDRARLEVLVGQQASVDGVRQPPFQTAQCFLGDLPSASLRW
jgi:hypothetical protein